jgi:hypothetical protein
VRFLFLLILLSSHALAFDNPYYIRSPRALLMGDAFTAVNDDEYTLFYNPASLARHKRDFSLTPFNPQINGTNVLGDMDKFENFPNEPVGASKVLMDYPAHVGAGIAPGFKLFNVGVSFLAGQSYDVLLRNQAHPMLDIDTRTDKGVFVGIGLPLGPSRLNRRSLVGSQTSIGISGKYVEREGIRDTMALAGPTVLNSLSRDELNDIVKSIGTVKGRAYGVDAGLEHVVRSSNTQFVIGLAALDIGGTNYKIENNPQKLQLADTRNQINLGMAGGQKYRFFNYILSGDIRALNEEMEFGKRLRLGAQIGIPGLSFLAGMNSGYFSYGASVDFFFMKLTAGFYEVELGSQYKQVKSERFVISLNLFDFAFDA